MLYYSSLNRIQGYGQWSLRSWITGEKHLVPMWYGIRCTVHTVIYIDSETRNPTNTDIYLYDGSVNQMYCIRAHEMFISPFVECLL